MTPQSTFMVLAQVAPGQEAVLRELLASMAGPAPIANPLNPLVPFGRFDRLHFARFVILEAHTADDLSVYDKPPRPWTPSLVFLGDCDGPADSFLRELVDVAGPGLRQIFGHCRDFNPYQDLLAWMQRHATPPAANYVNWIGRTVTQIREEAALHAALAAHVRAMGPDAPTTEPALLRARLLKFVGAERRAGRLKLTPPAPTPLGWRVGNLAHLIGVPLALLVLTPFLLVLSPLLLARLRWLERTNPEIVPRPDRARVEALAALEDHDVTNQFSAFGDAKPGRFRRWLVIVLLALLDYSARHIYNRGYLTRVQTIHFARWVLLDDKHRMFFASNYDGSLESYMDDFINKVAWGINAVFGNGLGFPRTSWLLKGGAEFEQKYKAFLHRHQVPTAVWYKAYPGLTAFDLNRNTRIRQGLGQRRPSDKEIRAWLGLL